MQARKAHETTVSSRGYLPYPLNPPYFVYRTEEYQERVFEYARNYFSPAEMDDLTRLELFFVPQEAERIKRNLRRKGDFEEGGYPGDSPTNMTKRNLNTHLAGSQGQGPLANDGRFNPIPTSVGSNPFNPNSITQTDLDDFVWNIRDPGLPPQLNPANRPGVLPRTYKSSSLLRRVELFIASMFVFDCAHGLLAHLHEEAISLTSHGTDADETLLKQIIRNVRGYSFRRMLPTKADNTSLDQGLIPDWNDASPMDIDTQGGSVVVPQQAGTTAERTYRPMKGPLESTIEDFSEPLSSTELKQLQTEGWISRDGKIYSPTRFPSSLATHIPGNQPDQRSRATNEGVMDPSRTMGIYPVTFLTNTTIADDACAARLVEHCSSETMDPEMFSWGMRRQVFMPLEVDIADIYRFGDLKIYDELHDALNSFSNGMFAGLSLRGLWADYLRPRLSQVVTQVPQNQLRPFTQRHQAHRDPCRPRRDAPHRWPGRGDPPLQQVRRHPAQDRRLVPPRRRLQQGLLRRLPRRQGPPRRPGQRRPRRRVGPTRPRSQQVRPRLPPPVLLRRPLHQPVRPPRRAHHPRRRRPRIRSTRRPSSRSAPP